MHNLTDEYVILCITVFFSLFSFVIGGYSIKKLKKNDFDENDVLNILYGIFAPLGISLGIVCAATAGLSVRDIYDEKHAVYNSVQDTLVVTGTYPSIERYKHVHGQYREYEYNHISAIDKNNQEYNMQFYADGKEPTFVERGDTIVINFQYRNGERMTDKDSIVANLTRQKMIRDALKSQVR